jgi:dTDP-glucose 4,6-dehydratase
MASNESKIFLVTGGAGFIGSNFILETLSADPWHRVVNLDALTYAGNLENLGSISDRKNYAFVQGNICDIHLLKGVFREYKPTVVIHFAAESHVDRSLDSPSEFIQTNIVGTYQLLEVAREYWEHLGPCGKESFKLIHVSTDEVFGSLGPEGHFLESSPYRPNSPYAASKASSDHLVRSYFQSYGLPTLISHCSNNYGPFQFPEKLVPLAVLKILQDDWVPIYGDGNQVRDWIYVHDHCRAILSLIAQGKPGGEYNIGSGNEKTNLEVVRMVYRELRKHVDLKSGGEDAKIQFIEDRPGHDRRYAIDSTKISRELGWKPNETFETGISKTVKWYLENMGWCKRIAETRYKGERLGLRKKGEGRKHPDAVSL